MTRTQQWASDANRRWDGIGALPLVGEKWIVGRMKPWNADSASSVVVDRSLAPGELSVGNKSHRLRALLGSCVAVTLWHSEMKLGGMCHGLVPTRSRPLPPALDGRFVDEAVDVLVQTLGRAGAIAPNLEAKVFGGGNMFTDADPGEGAHVGHRNVEAARARLASHGIRVLGDDVLGNYYRIVIFDIATGEVWIRRHSTEKPAPARGRQ